MVRLLICVGAGFARNYQSLDV